MATSSQIVGWVQRALDARDIRYRHEVVEGRDRIESQFSLDCKLQNSKVFINFSDDYYAVNAYVSLKADEKCRLKVAEYIVRATYGLKHGNFDMDFRDGEIRYRVVVDCQDRDYLSANLVLKSILLPVAMLDRYGDGLVAVMYGIQSPEEAIKEAESE